MKVQRKTLLIRTDGKPAGMTFHTRDRAVRESEQMYDIRETIRTLLVAASEQSGEVLDHTLGQVRVWNERYVAVRDAHLAQH